MPRGKRPSTAARTRSGARRGPPTQRPFRLEAAILSRMRSEVFNHFRMFGLGALYASHSGVELVNIRYGLQRIAERGTVEDIRAELVIRAESAEAAHINSWQTAMYYALAESDWFCADGFF